MPAQIAKVFYTYFQDPQGYTVTLSSDPLFIQEGQAFKVNPSHGFKETPFILTINNEDVLDYEKEDARSFSLTVCVLYSKSIISYILFQTVLHNRVFDPGYGFTRQRDARCENMAVERGAERRE